MARKGYPFGRRSDKQMTNLVSGLFTGMILTPFVALDYASKLDINNTSYNTKPKKVKSQPLIKAHQKLLIDLAKTTINKNIEYSKDIKSATILNQQILELNENIEKYIKLLKTLGFIPKLKHMLFKNIKATHCEINNLRFFNKIPNSINNNLSSEIKGYVFLDINNKINCGKQINLDKLLTRKGKTSYYYAINRTPTLSLFFKHISLYFFEDALALVSKENYVVVDSNTISINYKTITIDTSLVNKDEKQFNILDSQCRYFCKDGSIDLRYANYRIIEVGVLGITISYRTINLLFSNTQSGYMVYKSLLSTSPYTPTIDN